MKRVVNAISQTVAFGMMALLSAVPVCLSASAEGRVSFRQNRLYVDSKPFFFLGADGVPDSFESMRRHHLNAAFRWGAADIEAAKAGLMLIPYIHSPAAKLEEVEQQVTELRNEPALLGWNTGDDLVAKDLDKTRQVCEAVHRLDATHPVMLDVIDQSVSRFAPFVDMFCTYTYPLMKKDWALPRYREWLESAKEKVGKGKFRWTWVQVHTQFWYTHEVHGGPEDNHIPSLFPDAEHIRLLTYTAIQAGMRGIIYYHNQFLRNDWYGKDRYAEVGILGSELEVLGPLIAEGEVVGVAKTSAPHVHATVVQFGKGLLVLLVKQGNRYQYQPDDGLAKHVQVSLPLPQPPRSEIRTPKSPGAFQVGFPEVQSLPVQRRADKVDLIIPEFELTSAVLLTADAELVASIKRRVSDLVPDAARFALQVLEGKQEKVASVLQELSTLKVSLPEQSNLLAEAHRLSQQATDSLNQEQFANAYRAARQAQRCWRILERRHWLAAVGDKEPDNYRYLRCFYDVPKHYAEIRELESLVEGESLLSNGSFEEGEGAQAKDWSEPVMAHGRQASGGRTEAKRRTDKWCYHFAASSLALWEGEKWDWVTADVRSATVDVKQGEFVKLSAWVYIKETIRDTQRGAILNLLGFDGTGKTAPGWEGMKIEASQFKKTDGWRQLTLLRKVDDSRVAKVAARIGICGIGECYFDDVKLCRMVRRVQ